MRSTGERSKRVARHARRGLSKLIPALRRPEPSVRAVGLHAAVSTAADAVVVDRRMDWEPGESTAEKIERLHTQVDGIAQWINDLRSGVDERFSATETGFRELGGRLDRAVHELKQLHARADIRAVTTDARALPVVGAGVVLSGAPEAFSWMPWPLWAVAMATVAGLAFRLTWAAWRYRRDLSEGAR